MPDEALISQIENLLTEIIELGGANERTSIVPNLIVQDANPSGLDGFIIVSDPEGWRGNRFSTGEPIEQR
jgi:hypothetical protein